MKKNSIGLLLVLVLVASCETPFKSHGGSGGGSNGGGDVPTTEEMNNYLNSKMSVEIPRCSTLSIDESLAQRKYPIVKNSGRNQWTDEYSGFIADQFDKPYMEDLRNAEIKDSDLNQIGCPGYKTATAEEKKKFWILFLSSIAKPENDFDTSGCYKEGNKTRSCGILQIDFKAANGSCGLLASELGKIKNGKPNFTEEDMKVPSINLRCGLMLMDSQLHGGSPLNLTKTIPVNSIAKTTTRPAPSRPNIVGSLFVDNDPFYWSVLGERGKKLDVIDWFKKHAERQLPFCGHSHTEIVLNGETHVLDYQRKLTSRAKIGNCKFYFGANKKICEQRKKEVREKDILDETSGAEGVEIDLGEQPPTTKEESCDIVDDGNRTPKLPAGGTDTGNGTATDPNSVQK